MRQIEVLRLRDGGRTQQEVAEILGTTASNVSAVERAAEDNVAKARRTLELVRVLRDPVQFTIEAGARFDAIVERVYEAGDDNDISIDYCKPELYSHLYGRLENSFEEGHSTEPIELGITENGDVETAPATTDL